MSHISPVASALLANVRRTTNTRQASAGRRAREAAEAATEHDRHAAAEQSTIALERKLAAAFAAGMRLTASPGEGAGATIAGYLGGSGAIQGGATAKAQARELAGSLADQSANILFARKSRKA